MTKFIWIFQLPLPKKYIPTHSKNSVIRLLVCVQPCFRVDIDTWNNLVIGAEPIPSPQWLWSLYQCWYYTRPEIHMKMQRQTIPTRHIRVVLVPGTLLCPHSLHHLVTPQDPLFRAMTIYVFPAWQHSFIVGCLRPVSVCGRHVLTDMRATFDEEHVSQYLFF